MLIDRVARIVGRSVEFAPVHEKLGCGDDATLGVPQSARPFAVACAFALDPRPQLVVVPGEEACARFAMALETYLGRESVLVLPTRSERPWSDRMPDLSEMGRRIRALSALQSGENLIVVTSSRALLRRLPPASALPLSPMTFQAGSALGCPYGDLARRLVSMGYEHRERAEEPGTFAVHGDTVDVFEATSPYPVRIELFGDDIEAIRRVIPSTSQSIADLDEVDVYPCRELSPDAKAVEAAYRRLVSLVKEPTDEQERCFDMMRQGVAFPEEETYLPLLYLKPGSVLGHLNERVLITLVEPRALFDDASHVYDDLKAQAKAARCPIEGLYLEPGNLDFGANQRLTLLSLLRAGSTVDADLHVKSAASARSEQRFVSQIKALIAGDYLTILGIADRHAREDVELMLSDNLIPFADLDEDGGFTPHVVNVVDADVPAALILPGVHLALLNISDSSTRTAVYAGRKRIDPTSITFPFSVGDYVVHATHGVALFKEFCSREIDGIQRDYLLLEYAHGDKLFVPVEQVGRVTRYVGSGADAPRLTRLNTSDWSRVTGKARKSVKKLAFDLVDLYSRRASVSGYAYDADGAWQQEMELMFPYEETPDQLSAIADVKADMESSKPMDRLVCGDVGFGKTEVAVRAAFKAIQSGKQVMLLCPTTILAQQHYTTFSDRFSPFGIRVDILSRFRTDAQQRATLADYASGTVDMLVGTHRLLSSDVNPKDLGLVIIDEEQRFGVEHKEHLKNLREHIDILTLSATPIPRTLQMSLTGVRDMSLIETPPPHRRQVEVTVGEWNENLVSAAIRRELERDGQVYYVSNRVRSIDDAVARVQAVAPEARIGVAHGKMDPHAIENVMESFAAGQTDVLVSTTIIESGIDNPHTNTLIIEDSQRLGLAQLYQLKGRVGRSRVQAYAMFLFPPDRALTQEATDRLLAIQEFQELGSGMKIAMRDLEIRGAGSLLGAEQSGNISAVGFDLFASMLAEAVSEARGEQTVASHVAVVDLPCGFFLPEEYIPATDERVMFYRRFALADGLADADRIAEKLLRAYGPLPEAAENMVERVRVIYYMDRLGIHDLGFVRNKLVFESVELDADARSFVKSRHGIYYPKTKKLAYPVLDGMTPVACAREVLEFLSASRDAEEDEV